MIRQGLVVTLVDKGDWDTVRCQLDGVLVPVLDECGDLGWEHVLDQRVILVLVEQQNVVWNAVLLKPLDGVASHPAVLPDWACRYDGYQIALPLELLECLD